MKMSSRRDLHKHMHYHDLISIVLHFQMPAACGAVQSDEMIYDDEKASL